MLRRSFFAVLVLASVVAADEPTWRAGVGRRVITPAEPMWMSGYASRNKPAEGTLHELWTKALVLEDAGGERAVLVTLDLVGIGRELSRGILADLENRYGLEPSRVALCCSHTHTGPVVGHNLHSMYFLDDEHRAKVIAYAEKLRADVVTVVGDAIGKLAPATLAHGTGEATFAVNRRTNREADVPMLREAGRLLGPVDHAVPVLVVRGETGEPRAIVGGYACHATVLSFYQWSGDWPGFGQIELEKRFPGATAMVWAGCGADQNPLPRRKVELGERYGAMFADAVERVVRGEPEPIAPTLRTAREEIPLAFADLPTREAIEADTESSNKYVVARAKHLLETLDRDGKLDPTYPYPVQAWRLGNDGDDVTFVLLGGEVVVDYALRLRAEVGGTTWVAGYANDVMAYIPSRRVLLEGGYEGGGAMVYYGQPTVWSERVEEQIVEAVHEVVGSLDEDEVARAPRLLEPRTTSTAQNQPSDTADAPTGRSSRGADPVDVSHIRVPEGYEVSVAAGPPLVSHPTMACFDHRGRLYVCENAGVNLSAAELEEQLPNSIRRLEDTDGDGTFDRATVFADRMTFPMGACWHDGSLFVASPPNIWRLTDTDDDGVADERKVIVGRFGYTGNAASIHGCFLGPAGRIWWCDGYHGHEFEDEAGNVTSKRKGSYIFSCDPDGGDVRIHCGGGMDNPVELDFTAEGEPIGTVNILYTRPRVDCLVHWQRGGVYPHREGILEEMPITGELLGPIHRFGHVAVSGTCRVRSDRLDPEWTDDFLVTFFNRGRVVRCELERSGATFTTTEREFLSSTNREFHPTDVLEDADGSLLVVDTGGWFYRGCPTSQFPKPDLLGSIVRICRTDAKPLKDPRGNGIAWNDLEPDELVALLDDDLPLVRERAIDAFARHENDAVLEAIRRVRGSKSERMRVNAIWALARRGHGHPDRRQRFLSWSNMAGWRSDPSPNVLVARQIAVQSAGSAFEYGHSLTGSSPALRRALAEALGASRRPDAVRGLVPALEDAVDRAEEHAIVFALIEIGEAPREALSHESPNVRRGVLVARDQIPSIEQSPDEVAPLLDDPNDRVRREAIRILLAHPDWANFAAERLPAWLASPERRDDARRVVAGFAGDAEVAAVIGRVLGDSNMSVDVRVAVLNGLADANRPAVDDSWVAPITRALGDEATSTTALAAVASLRSDRFDAPLAELGRDPLLPRTTRIRALEAARRGSGIGDDAFSLLLALLDDGSPSEVAAAGRWIGGASLSKPQLVALAPRLSSAGPMLLGDVLRPYGRNQDPEVGTALLAALEDARSFDGLPPHEFSDVVKRYPTELRDRANALLDRLLAEDDRRRERIDRLLATVDAADVERGRVVFHSERAKCATCHRVGEKGGRIGPDLTTIGANRTARDLAESIVFPSATIVREYEPYTIVTDAGRTYSGLVVRETSDSLTVQPATGDPVVVPRNEVLEVVPATVSVMPKGLDGAVSEGELADLVAYLRALR